MSAENDTTGTGLRSQVTDTGRRTPPVFAARSFQVYELPGGTVELHLTADGGKTIAWSMSGRMARALGTQMHRQGTLAERSPLPVGPSMQPSSKRGAVQLAAIAVIGAVLLVGGLFWKTSRLQLFERGPSAAEVQKKLGKLDVNQAAVDAAVAQALAAERAARAEQERQTRTGQSLVAATGEALAAAGPAAQADPAVQFAGKANAKAGEALTAAVGPLTPELRQWAVDLVRNATSASESARAQAEQALQLSDRQLRDSEARESQHLREAAAAEAKAAQLEQINSALHTQLEETLAEKDRVGGLLDRVLHWALYFGIAYTFAMWVLPFVAAVFPALAPVNAAIHAIVAPLGAKALSEAKSLAHDASAALHNVLTRVQAKAPAVAAEAEAAKAEWITEADGTAARYQDALRATQQL